MELGEKLQSIRKSHNLSQSDLAEKLDVSRQSVSKWETGTATPELSKLIQISELFNISLDEMTGRKEHTDPEERRSDVAESWPQTKVRSNSIVGLIGKTYNSTLLSFIDTSVLLFVFVPVHVFLYENGYYGPLSFSFIEQFDLVGKSLLQDVPFILLLLGFYFRRVIRKDYKYRKVTRMDLGLSVLIFSLSIILPIYLWLQNSFWTSFVILAGQIGLLVVMLNISLLFIFTGNRKTMDESLE
ncbi:helix-turn-helix domain-containing protein [Proteiniclasticum sp. C24MP]|uniref:helix-turn-helix domain-containing protein n=1 Tax=Proteiniclasticum sp. C24MP TaxID=3374101 RepID=UPI003754B417